MAISAACSKANTVKIPNHIVNLDANSFPDRGVMTALGSRLAIPPLACAMGRRKLGINGILGEAWLTNRVAKTHSKP